MGAELDVLVGPVHPEIGTKGPTLFRVWDGGPEAETHIADDCAENPVPQ